MGVWKIISAVVISHTVWDCKYHVVWTTKYRYEVLGSDVGVRCRELIREIARSQEMIIYAGSVNRDHVHMLIGIPPNLLNFKNGEELRRIQALEYEDYKHTFQIDGRLIIAPYEQKTHDFHVQIFKLADTSIE